MFQWVSGAGGRRVSDEDDKVSRLPVRFKQPPGEEGRTLKIVDTRFSRDECDHVHLNGAWNRRVTYLIRKGETEVECSGCGTKLDPMFVLALMANSETDWLRTRELYVEEMKRLSERKATKCQKCGYMTRISRAKATSA
jgi:hypothetical protein